MYVLRPLPEIWDPKILETRFFVLEQLLFAMTIRTDDDITLLIAKLEISRLRFNDSL